MLTKFSLSAVHTAMKSKNISGDNVSNVKLNNIVEIHKQRRQQDKNAIMTVVLKPFKGKNDEDVLFVIDPQTSECLHYEPHDPNLHPSSLITLDIETTIARRPVVEIRYDLTDCGIDICSLDVLALLSENFDHQDLRKDFVKGVLESDLFGQKIYCHILESGQYAARVKNTKLYDAISKDVLKRWTFPLVPDFFRPDQTYSIIKMRIYMEEEGMKYVERTSSLHGYCIVGSESRIGHNSKILNSAIGRSCHIGSNVTSSCVFAYVYIICNKQNQ